LSYAPTTGIFRWKVSAGSRAPVGAIAGARNGRGYHQIRIGGRPYSASRLAWLYMTGKWPNSEISYINGKPSDTRWANLRDQNRSCPRSKQLKRLRLPCPLYPQKQTSLSAITISALHPTDPAPPCARLKNHAVDRRLPLQRSSRLSD